MLKQVKERIIPSINGMAGLSFHREKYQGLQRVMNRLGFMEHDGVLIVDCRDPVGEEATTLDHEGNTLMSSEKARYVLGFGDRERFTTLVSTTGCGDLRKGVLLDADAAVKTFKQYMDTYLQNAAKESSLDGGSVTYKPAFICISNFGWDIQGFKSQYVLT